MSVISIKISKIIHFIHCHKLLQAFNILQDITRYTRYICFYHSCILHRSENRTRPISAPYNGRRWWDSNLRTPADSTTVLQMPYNYFFAVNIAGKTYFASLAFVYISTICWHYSTVILPHSRWWKMGDPILKCDYWIPSTNTKLMDWISQTYFGSYRCL